MRTLYYTKWIQMCRSSILLELVRTILLRKYPGYFIRIDVVFFIQHQIGPDQYTIIEN